MEKVTSLTISDEQIRDAVSFLGYESIENVSRQELAFYYNQFQEGLSLGDADAYANLNTILGYDIGKTNFCALDDVIWEQYDIALIEITGTDREKSILQEAAKKLKLEIDFTKWKNLDGVMYSFEFFE